jgi:hypothetical protein
MASLSTICVLDADQKYFSISSPLQSNKGRLLRARNSDSGGTTVTFWRSVGYDEQSDDCCSECFFFALRLIRELRSEVGTSTRETRELVW